MATGLCGTVVIRQIEMDGSVQALVKPKGVDPDTGEAVKGFWAVEKRLSGGEHEDVNYPSEVLGTEVTDPVTGISGTAVALVYHLTGCLHVVIQPKGKTKSGEPLKSFECDIRRLEGMTSAVSNAIRLAFGAESKRTKPSPDGSCMVRNVPNDS